MFGQVNEDGEMTGGSVAYIYPDRQTALCGSFVDGELIEARHASVICSESERPRFEIIPNSKHNSADGKVLFVLVCAADISHMDNALPLFSDFFFVNNFILTRILCHKGPVYSYDKSTSTCIATHTLLPDPYESQR